MEHGNEKPGSLNARHWFYFHMALVLCAVIPTVMADFGFSHVSSGSIVRGMIGSILMGMLLIGSCSFPISLIFPIFFGFLIFLRRPRYGAWFLVVDVFLLVLHFLTLAPWVS